ncbi:MAG: DUF2065 family protein [Betaproteobacteria bacterium]
MSDLWPLALGLVLVLEGLLPLLAPGSWRFFFSRVAAMRDGQIRFMGLIATAMGVALIAFSELK